MVKSLLSPAWLVTLLGAVLPLGCGSGGGGPLAPVAGKISYKGAALRSGSIVFSPDTRRGSSGPLARGEIQADGSYNLRTGDAIGAIPGWHRVTVVAVDGMPYSYPDGQFAVPRSLLPEKYRDPDLSGLSCEVKLGKENKIDLNLE